MDESGDGLSSTGSRTTAQSFKVVLLGEGCVGKTSLVLRYTEDKFNDKHVSTLQVRLDGCWRYIVCWAGVAMLLHNNCSWFLFVITSTGCYIGVICQEEAQSQWAQNKLVDMGYSRTREVSCLGADLLPYVQWCNTGLRHHR